MVRPIPRVADAYEIIAGERRWRAAQRAGRHDIPVIVVEAGDREALEIAIVENVQRADLNALEEAAGYAQLGADYGYSHGDIARVVGKSRSHVANTTRLTHLPEHTRALLAGGQISAGHARALLAVADPDALADRIVAQGLTVRDIERLSENPGKTGRPRKAAAPVDPDTAALEDKLGLALGTKVTIRHDGESGQIRIAFRDFEQLDDFCRQALPAGGAVGGVAPVAIMAALVPAIHVSRRTTITVNSRRGITVTTYSIPNGPGSRLRQGGNALLSDRKAKDDVGTASYLFDD